MRFSLQKFWGDFSKLLFSDDNGPLQTLTPQNLLVKWPPYFDQSECWQHSWNRKTISQASSWFLQPLATSTTKVIRFCLHYLVDLPPMIWRLGLLNSAWKHAHISPSIVRCYPTSEIMCHILDPYPLFLNEPLGTVGMTLLFTKVVPPLGDSSFPSFLES